MKILFVHQFFARPEEAGEVRHLKLFEYLAPQGFKFQIIGGSLNYFTGQAYPGFSGLSQELEFSAPGISGVRVYAAPTYRKGFLGRLFCYFTFLFSSLWESRKIKAADLLLSTSPSLFTALSGYLISRLKKIPFYFEVRDLWPQAPVEMGMLKNKLLIALSYKLEMFLAQRARQLIVLTKGYKDYFVKLGISPEKITVLPNGADEDWLEYSGGDLPPEFNSFKDKFLVVYAGAIGHFNYLEKLIEAAEDLKADPEIHFLLIGDGNARESLQEKVKALGLSNLGFLPARARKELPPLLFKADLGVVIYPPIPLSKALLMNKLLDYLSLGLPTLLMSEEGVSSELLSSAEGGFRVGFERGELAAKISWAKTNKSRLKEMGVKGRAYLKEHFLRKNLAEQLADCFKKGELLA